VNVFIDVKDFFVRYYVITFSPRKNIMI